MPINNEDCGRIVETTAQRVGSGFAIINFVAGVAQPGDALFGFFGFPMDQSNAMHIKV
jgi:hypothetical protein